jgi:hypothetical protein
MPGPAFVGNPYALAVSFTLVFVTFAVSFAIAQSVCEQFHVRLPVADAVGIHITIRVDD